MSGDGRIPLVDLVAPHKELEDELVDVFRTALRSAGFIGGPMVEAFEADFAQFCDAAHGVGVGSGTDALRFALQATGIEPGDLVITVPNTFIATTEAISQVGAHPDFVDVDPCTSNMDAGKLEAYIDAQCTVEHGTRRLFHKRSGRPVTAIVPVHLYGQPVDMDPVLALAARHNLIVVEDACQAHGAEYFSKSASRWRTVGSLGHAAAFSFYPGKNLGACGEAGAVTTNDAATAQRVRILRDHGQTRKYHHQTEGYNGRLDAMQAGILSAKLKRLRAWNGERRDAAYRYRELFASLSDQIGLPVEPDWVRAVYHLFVIRVPARDALQAHLAEAGISTGIHYPIPLHLQEAYRHLGYQRGDFPISEGLADGLLSLPMYPQLDINQQRHVVRTIEEFLRHRPEAVRSAVAASASN